MFISSHWHIFVGAIALTVVVIMLFLMMRNRISVLTSHIVSGIVMIAAITIAIIPSCTSEAKEVRVIRAERSYIWQAAEQCVEIHGELTPYLKERIEAYNQSVDALDADSFWMKVLTDNDTSKYYINEQELTERQDDNR